MGRRVNIPVRIIRPTERSSTPPVDETAIPATKLHAADPPLPTGPTNLDRESRAEPAVESEPAATRTNRPAQVQTEPAAGKRDELRGESEEWRDRALRLQADMENFRKRQQRNAQNQIGQERKRLLNAFLGIVDDLERALAAPDGDDTASCEEGLRRGVELTHRAALQLVQKEGAVAITAEQQPFDPNWHEAVATVPRNGAEVTPGTVIKVVEPGYRLDDQLLRPAKVVVAV
jgi:molecular chaperone GrpE